MKSSLWHWLHRLCPFGIVKSAEKEKPGDQEKPDDQEKPEKPGDQEKLGEKSNKIKNFPWSKKNEAENQDKRERVIRERLARFARVPRSTVFEFVTQDSFLLFYSLTNSK